jgi:hypothetical protein
MKKSLNEKRDGFNRRELLNKAREIVNFIEQAHKSGLADHEVEEALFRQIIELGYRALGMFFVLCGEGDEGEAMTLAEDQRVRRLGEWHKRGNTSLCLVCMSSGVWCMEPEPGRRLNTCR